MFAAVWTGFRSRWQTFALIGLGRVVLSIGAVVLIACLFLFTTVFDLSVAAFRQSRGMPVPSDLGDLFGSLGVASLLTMGLTLLVGALSLSGQAGAIAALRRGEQVGFGTFWVLGWRNLWRTLGLQVLVALTLWGIGLVLVLPLSVIMASTISNASRDASALATLGAVLLGAAVVMLAAAFLLVNLGIYPAYLIAADGLGAGAAYARGWAIIARCFGQAVQSWLVLVLIGLCLALGVVLMILPLVGQLLYLAVWLLLQPFLVYYFSERYEATLRPHFS